jgi:hypothetical protein
LQGTVSSAPPKTGATIVTPTSGQTFTSLPITVSGLCPNNLLVKVFSNNVFVGSTMCTGGSYSIQVDLFEGRNDIVVRVYDALDQPGPDSNVVTVTFNSPQFNSNNIPLITLTSNYAQRGANPGDVLNWPVILSGGTAPYAISVNWGDSKSPDLLSEQFAGTINLSHIYDSAGVYTIIVKATDKNGLSAYLQLVGIANGAITQTTSSSTSTTTPTTVTKTKVLWLPAAITIILLPIGFWLGQKYKITSLRRHLSRQSFND